MVKAAKRVVIMGAAGLEPLLGLAKYLAYMNMALVLFNVIPGYPLDGGRVFRAIVWAITGNMRRATLIAANAGRFFAFMLVVTLAVDAIILYPVQTAANLLAYESGYFHAVEVRRLGLGMLLLTIVVALLVLPYWELLALPLVSS